METEGLNGSERDYKIYIYGTSYIRSRKLSWTRYVGRSDETRAIKRFTCREKNAEKTTVAMDWTKTAQDRKQASQTRLNDYRCCYR